MIARTFALVMTLGVVTATSALAAPAGMKIVATVAFASGKTVSNVVKLPGLSHKVFVGVEGGQLFCEHVRLQSSDGSMSSLFMDSDVNHGKGAAMESQGGYVGVEADCHGTPTGRLIVAVPSR